MAKNIFAPLIKSCGIAVLRSFDFMVGHFADNKDVWPPETFPFKTILSDNKNTFLSEYLQLQQRKKVHNVKDFFIVETDINSDSNWKAAPLILFNYLFNDNVSDCPETFKIVTQLPGCCGAMFSVLGPGKYISPHKGIYKGIYRCLLTLQVEPHAECWIRVNKEKIYFKEGECIVFDETVEHEVLNESAYPRIALFLDIQRKFPFPLSILNAGIYFLLRKSSFVANILSEYSNLEATSYQDHTPREPLLT